MQGFFTLLALLAIKIVFNKVHTHQQQQQQIQHRNETATAIKTVEQRTLNEIKRKKQAEKCQITRRMKRRGKKRATTRLIIRQQRKSLLPPKFCSLFFHYILCPL